MLAYRALIAMLIIVVPPVICMFRFSGALRLLPKWLRPVTLLYSPLVAILLMIPSIAIFTTKNTMAKWIVFLLLFLPVLLLTITRLRSPRIIKLVDNALGSKKVFWQRRILNLCMFSALVMLVFMPDDPVDQAAVFIFLLYAVVVVSFGNLQIPAAAARVGLTLWRLIEHNYYGDNENDPAKTNLEPSLDILYGIVLSQGILYLVACIVEIFSFIPRRSLVRRGGFRDQWGVESVNLYYGYALEKCMERDVLAKKKICLSSFAMDSLDSDSPKMRLHGIRMMHCLLQGEPTRTLLLSKLTTRTGTIARLISMLEWTSPSETTIRLFAAKVTAELAKSLRVNGVAIPGTVQVVSALLDTDSKHKRGHPLLDVIDGEQEQIHDSENKEEIQNAVLDSGNLLETQDRSTHQVGIAEHSSWILRWWRRISKFWSVPQEEPLTEQDLLPALGMSILDGLAGCDQENCVEISRASSLISKIVGFTSYCTSDTIYTDAQRKALMKSSMKLLHSLTSIDGEIGITLRHKISKHPFLLRNLADILGDSLSSQELRKLVAGTLRNLAVDGNAREAIGRIQSIMTRLMQAFLSPDGPSSTDDDQLLRKVAGQALAMLAMESVNNCLAMLREPGYEFIKVLTSMIYVDRYRCVAASLLRSMILHARPELKETDLKELSYSLREVLERTLLSEGAELEIHIGLSSQISKAIPGEFFRELEHGQIKETFVKRLVDALNANKEPGADCPGIRRMLLEQAINLMEYDSRYANRFNDLRMADVLSLVEETASEVENYNLFLGDAGLMETGQTLSSLVARAKQLLAVR
ncbi:uncharacterized protein LOC133891503 [Phragmites australis]|uniref:uncharacterized protein LOC133891503 n=1 Tax=Phragmites australis TaxID=29695 RepID=UPI002D768196|nr:uncharacterized protein LOC133891503 [Phragmites australis]